jgi:hypothetical protein
MQISTISHSDPRTNQLLRELPDDAWGRWVPYLEPVRLILGQVLSEPSSRCST